MRGIHPRIPGDQVLGIATCPYDRRQCRDFSKLKLKEKGKEKLALNGELPA